MTTPHTMLGPLDTSLGESAGILLSSQVHSLLLNLAELRSREGRESVGGGGGFCSRKLHRSGSDRQMDYTPYSLQVAGRSSWV